MDKDKEQRDLQSKQDNRVLQLQTQLKNVNKFVEEEISRLQKQINNLEKERKQRKHDFQSLSE
jgi:hypothetical protein